MLQQTVDLAGQSGQFPGEQAYQALLRSSCGATAEARNSAAYNDYAASRERQMPFGRDDGAQQAGVLKSATIAQGV